MQTPPGRRASIEAAQLELQLLEQEVEVLSTNSKATGISQGRAGQDLPAADPVADPAADLVVPLADWRRPSAEACELSRRAEAGPEVASRIVPLADFKAPSAARSGSSRSSRELLSVQRRLRVALAAAHVPPALAEAMVSDNIDLEQARQLGPALMADFFSKEKGMSLSAFSMARISAIFSTAASPPPPQPPAPPRPTIPAPVLASLISCPPGPGGPGVAAQPSSGLGAPAATPSPPLASTTASMGLQTARGVWLYTKCARDECPCAATFNGQVGQFCCAPCREGTACTGGRHMVPSTPDEFTRGRRLMPMPISMMQGLSLLREREIFVAVGTSLSEMVAMLYAWQCDDAARLCVASPAQAELATVTAAAEQATALAAAASAELRRQLALAGGRQGPQAGDTHAANCHAILPQPPTISTPSISSAEAAPLSADERVIVTECKSKARNLQGDLWALFEHVPDERMPYVLKAFMRQYEPTRSALTDVRDVDFQRFSEAIVQLHVYVAASFRDAGQSGAAAFKQCSKK
jgi:hypothetical protein